MYRLSYNWPETVLWFDPESRFCAFLTFLLSWASLTQICTFGQPAGKPQNATFESCVQRNHDLQEQENSGKTSMAAKRILANGSTSCPARPLSATNLQFSNRQLPLLESYLNHWKQTMAVGSNRQLLRCRLFRPAQPPENCIRQRIDAPVGIHLDLYNQLDAKSGRLICSQV
jgi:hypothetical protein